MTFAVTAAATAVAAAASVHMIAAAAAPADFAAGPLLPLLLLEALLPQLGYAARPRCPQ